MEERTCSVEDCGKPVKTMGRCSGHAERFRLKGVDGGPLLARSPRPPHCTEPGCDRPVRARGRCSTHDARVRNGSKLTGPIIRPGRPALPREQRLCRGCGRTVERLHPRIYVLCEDCARKPAKPRRRYYGKTWRIATEMVRERDGGRCRSCGRTEQEEGRRLATAHIVPFDVALSLGWPEAKMHHPANLLLLCAACHKAYDRQPGWAFDVEADCRPDPPAWATEFRVEDLVAFVVEHYPQEVRKALGI